MALVTGGFIALLGLEKTAGQASADEKKDARGEPYKLVAPLGILMEFGETMFYEIDDEDLKAAKIKYRTIRKKALVLAELANVTFHHKPEEGSEKKWKAYAAKNREDLLKLAAASKAKNEKEVKSLWSKVEQTCDSCHEDFRD